MDGEGAVRAEGWRSDSGRFGKLYSSTVKGILSEAKTLGNGVLCGNFEAG